MMGVQVQDPDYSEFVEVDPTGRYGRVPALTNPSIVFIPFTFKVNAFGVSMLANVFHLFVCVSAVQ